MAEQGLDQEIGSRIRRAREEAGLSQHDLARKLGYASPATVSYMEAGERRITVADLAAVAGALGLQLSYLLPVAAQEEPELHFSFRAQDIRNINPLARRAVIDFLLFAQKNGQQCLVPLDGLRRKRPSAAAEAILKLAGMAEPPIGPRDVARGIGVPVFDWEFGDEISGIFVCYEGKTAIGVNESHPVVRQRFTVAHELGHFVYSDREAIVFDYLGRERGFSFEMSETVDAERKANQFAADLLMPAAWIRGDVHEKSPDLRQLSKRYGVSEQAMWFRLQNLKLIPSEEQSNT